MELLGNRNAIIIGKVQDMPFKKGHSPQVVSENIKEMMRSGKPQKQSIAASLASARKYKKMWKGGMYDEGGVVKDTKDQAPSLDPEKVKQFQFGSVFNPQGKKKMADGGMVESDMDQDSDPEDYITSIEEERLLGTPHENEVENPEEQYEASMFAQALRKKREMMMGPESFAMGGLVQPPHDPDMGNKPSEDMSDDESEEPQSVMPGRDQPLEHSMNVEPSGSELSSEARAALMRKKQGRRYVQRS